MKKSILLIVLLLIAQTNFSQRGQIIAYIDMDYILENVPEYVAAEKNLNNKITVWKANLVKLERHIEVLKTDLVNEKAILTKDIIEEREENITIKQEELARLESLYFGPNGDMFILRKQLVKPIQDQIYDAIQDIVKKKKYDFVLDKSSDLVMLYSNKKYDISELVLNSIVKERKIKENKKKLEQEAIVNGGVSEREKLRRDLAAKKAQALKDRIAKANALKQAKKEKIAAQRKAIQLKKEAKLREIAKQRKAIQEKRAKKIKDLEAKKKLSNNKKGPRFRKIEVNKGKLN